MSKVVKLAQPGYDVKTAGDENLIYSSEWPLLKIYKQGSFKRQGGGGFETIFEHNLGYPPACWSFQNNIIQNSFGSFGFPFTVSERAAIASRGTFVDNKKLYFSSVVDPAQIYYYIFALDLSIPYTAPVINRGKQPEGTPPKTVFKIAKEGKSIASNNLEDYVLHSQCRSPLIHAVAPLTSVPDATFYSAVYYHNLGYIPLYFVYDKIPDFGYALNTSGSISVADEQKITVTGTAAAEYTVVVLKDPFVISNTVTVNV